MKSATNFVKLCEDLGLTIARATDVAAIERVAVTAAIEGEAGAAVSRARYQECCRALRAQRK